jgi:osomolarity two-component system phosphorelay intermediate protein YPD1
LQRTTSVDFGSNVDQAVFDQILDMDDNDGRSFSKDLVWGFFEQAETAFSEMQVAL